jgi:hypothetical protein
MPKKRLLAIVGGTFTLVAVAAVAYFVGKHTRSPAIDTNRFVRVVPPAERQRRTEGTPPTQPPPYQYPQTTSHETLATLVGRCSACNGRGFFSDPTICPVCGGAGKVIGVRIVGYVGGIPIYQRDNAPTLCPYCRGYGFFLPSFGRCETCGGRTTGDWLDYWQQLARQHWLTTSGGRYAEINMTP